MNLLVGGLVVRKRASIENRIPTTSAKMCNASVMMAKLLDTQPPESKT